MTIESYFPYRNNGLKRTFTGLSHLLRAYTQLQLLNKLKGESVVNMFGGKINEVFLKNSQSKEASPVLICAKNEQDTLPQLLYALSRATVPLNPIVVDNNSEDLTGNFAKKLGAKVITEPHHGLIFALKKGFQFLYENHFYDKPILLTDADSFPVYTWAKELKSSIESTMRHTGGEIFGPVYYYGNGLTGLVISRANFQKDRSLYLEGFVKARGPNAIILPDQSGNILKALSDMDDSFVTGTDELVRDTVLKHGGQTDKIWSKNALVFSKADRFKSLRTLHRVFVSKTQTFTSLYEDWYKERQEGKRYVSPYRPTHGKEDWYNNLIRDNP